MGTTDKKALAPRSPEVLRVLEEQIRHEFGSESQEWYEIITECWRAEPMTPDSPGYEAWKRARE